MSIQTNDKCSHGRTWAEDCPDCDAVSKTEQLRWLIRDADKAADFMELNPGLVRDPRVIPDLYRTISRLAKAIAATTGGEDEK